MYKHIDINPKFCKCHNFADSNSLRWPLKRPQRPWSMKKWWVFKMSKITILASDGLWGRIWGHPVPLNPLLAEYNYPLWLSDKYIFSPTEGQTGSNFAKNWFYDIYQSNEKTKWKIAKCLNYFWKNPPYLIGRIFRKN